MISVLIPVKNGGEDLVRCLERIAAQRVDDEVEIVVVDSGSTDASVAIAEAAGARVEQIPPETFDHGGTRNLAARLARGETLVFTSQDAYAEHDDWLAKLVAPLEEANVAGVYGRQLAHHDAHPPEVYFLDFLYGPRSRRQSVAADRGISMETTLFSNVNAAIPRDVFERYPFAEDIIMSEDQEWSRRILLAGNTVAYEAEAPVRHSHNYTIGAAFKRFFDSGVSASRSYGGSDESSAVLRRRSLDYARGEIGWLIRSGNARWIPYTLVYEAAKATGLLLGMNNERLPDAVKPRLSALDNHWRR